MIARAAVLPNPPLLVPELVGGALAETEPLRTACLQAARMLVEVSPDWLAVAPGTADRVEPHAVGTFRGFGVDVTVSLADGATGVPDPDLPLPALVAGWLREQAGARRVLVEFTQAALVPAALDRAVATSEPMGLLVLGDGSNRHGLRAPGYADERSGGFDASVADALATADPAALLDVDLELAAELNAHGVAAWRALALAVRASGRRWRSELLYSDAPFGVGYHVAVWDPA